MAVPNIILVAFTSVLGTPSTHYQVLCWWHSPAPVQTCPILHVRCTCNPSIMRWQVIKIWTVIVCSNLSLHKPMMKHWNLKVKYKKRKIDRCVFSNVPSKCLSEQWTVALCIYWILLMWDQYIMLIVDTPASHIVDETKWNVEWMDPNCWEQQRLNREILIQVSSFNFSELYYMYYITKCGWIPVVEQNKD